MFKKERKVDRLESVIKVESEEFAEKIFDTGFSQLVDDTSKFRAAKIAAVTRFKTRSKTSNQRTENLIKFRNN